MKMAVTGIVHERCFKMDVKWQSYGLLRISSWVDTNTIAETRLTRRLVGRDILEFNALLPWNASPLLRHAASGNFQWKRTSAVPLSGSKV